MNKNLVWVIPFIVVVVGWIASLSYHAAVLTTKIEQLQTKLISVEKYCCSELPAQRMVIIKEEE